jgi:hypothetical protein
MNVHKRPQRKKRGDRLLDSGAARNEIACDYAVAPLDQIARQMDRKWGVDRLPELVSPAMAERYGHAIADLNAAIESADPASVVATAQNCIKGLQVMDAEAEAAGMPKASADYAEYEIEGFKFAVMLDGDHWQACQEARPDLRFFTLREIGVALKALRIDNPIFSEIKKHFPQAQIDSIAERAKPKTYDDPIPF